MRNKSDKERGRTLEGTPRNLNIKKTLIYNN
jgi:hypothetical protein